MNKITIEGLKEYKDFLILELEDFKVVFTTAKDNRSFDRHTEEGLNALDSIKEEFGVKEVIYTKQVHSDFVVKYEGEDVKEIECDGIVSNKKDVALGVFTADCVPIILINKELGVASAVHSGWKGTIKGIVKDALKKMEEEYGCNNENTIAIIGPHNRVCCYEVSEELKEKFVTETKMKETDIFKGRNLNLEEVIKKDLKEMGVCDENLYSLPLCTFCEENIKLHSYRKSVGTYGRLFTFVIKK